MRSIEFRESPWTVAIYYTRPGTKFPVLIPGTIISPYLIVTSECQNVFNDSGWSVLWFDFLNFLSAAAINFYADYQRGILTTESMNVIVAKRTKEVESMDDQFQKTYNVSRFLYTTV